MTNAIELAKKAGIPLNRYELIGCNRCQRDIDDELERFAKLVRNAALEEAAQVAEGYPKHGDATAEEIRNLKEPT